MCFSVIGTEVGPFSVANGIQNLTTSVCVLADRLCGMHLAPLEPATEPTDSFPIATRTTNSEFLPVV
jgi:hypothetical protein